MIGYHFTNYKTRWGGRAPWQSTGFVENIIKNGARAFLNIGVGNPSEVRKAFQHHGTRCNKKHVNGDQSIPAVIIFNIVNLPMQQGYDGPLHRQVNVPIPTEQVIRWFPFDSTMSDEDFEELCAVRSRASGYAFQLADKALKEIGYDVQG